ncbi:hypothetical protein FJU31_05440 [Stenotrophomonas cyclobalanopsidis]|uniref:Uncharacterized protein n=1 Tax=Stenotrophomonas cyclobalanopsidis TaxID=2771362 RepID=A0ABQ6T3S0_9GAMM|nr:hypothetical protein [Stenotrophomonas cyclobalanopsidis]KAA9002317.1 hypothetical protein FJU31_05440 [Stenotrophomonas cyclobalanopsidis]
MNTRRMRSITASVLLLSTGTLSAQTLHADDRSWFADAAAEQAARTRLSGTVLSSVARFVASAGWILLMAKGGGGGSGASGSW